MKTSEVLTTAIVGTKFFGGNYERSRKLLAEHGYINSMQSKSRFNRRLHMIEHGILQGIFSVMALMFKAANPENVYAIDSFPIPVCSNVRIWRCKIYEDKDYMSYSAIRNDRFFGIRVHMLVTQPGAPVNFSDSSISELAERKMQNVRTKECVPRLEELLKLLLAQSPVIFLKRFMPLPLMVLNSRFLCLFLLILLNLW